MTVNSRITKALFLILTAVVMSYVVWNSPLVSDDLYYKSFNITRLSDIFHFALTYNNGRLFGNMLIHFIVRSPVFRTVFQTSVILLLWFLTYVTSKPKNSNCYIACIVLFLAISPTIFREAYLWSSANYLPGIICMLISFGLVRSKPAPFKNLLIILVSISGQLFAEHTTLINVVFASCILYSLLKSKADKSQILSAKLWLIGTIIGSVIMFLIPKLFYITNDWENYQKVNLGSMHELIVSVVGNGMQIAGIYLQNALALIILSVIVVALSKPKAISKAILLLTPIYGFITSFIVNDIWDSVLCGMISLITLILYVASVVINIIRSDSVTDKPIILFYLGMCVFSVCPLLVVYPIGARCLLHSYVFLVLAIISMLNNLEAAQDSIFEKLILFSSGVACILSCFFMAEFHKVGYIDRERLMYIQEMIDSGSTSIDVPRIPSIYVKANNNWDYGQIYYQTQKHDIEFRFIEYFEWKSQINSTYDINALPAH